MATIRYGSTASGRLTFGAPQPIQSVSFTPKPPDPVPPDPPQPIPPDPIPPTPPMPPQIAGFLTWTKHFITAENGGDDAGVLHAVDRPGTPTPPQRVGPWETFTIAQSGDKVTLQSSNGRYWSAERGGGPSLDPNALVTCSRTVANPNPDSWERFTLLHNGDGTVSLKGLHGFYVSCEADGRITCNRTAIGPYESFLSLPPGSVVPQPPTPLPPGQGVPRVRAHANDPVFRLDDGSAWRMKGITAFKLCELWRTGGNWRGFLDAYAGFNTVRVFSYTEGPNWTDPTWESPSPSQLVDFAGDLNTLGWYLWWVCLTSSSPARHQHASDEVQALSVSGLPNIFLQGANEPERQNPDATLIDTSFLEPAMGASGYPWDNGYSDVTAKHHGTFYDWHSKRDSEWPRRSHDAMDIYSPPSDAPAGTVAMKMPIVLGEPPKLEDVGYSVVDWKGYFGSGAFFGAGVVFHAKTGKFCDLPTTQERQLAAAALMGLTAFPPDATLGTYGRIDGDGLRTYKKTANGTFAGNCMTRIRPNTGPSPEPGWTSLESDHVLWKR